MHPSSARKATAFQFGTKHRMLRIASRVLIVCCLVLVARYVHARANTEQLVADCRQEAIQAHFRAGRALGTQAPEVNAHRRRMLAICTRWLDAKREEAPRLLPQCLREANLGLHVTEHGIDVDHGHVARLERLCRALAEAVSE